MVKCVGGLKLLLSVFTSAGFKVYEKRTWTFTYCPFYQSFTENSLPLTFCFVFFCLPVAESNDADCPGALQAAGTQQVRF